MFTNARKKQKRLGGTSIVVSLRCKFSPNILQAIYIKIALRIKHHQQGRTSGIRPHPAFDSTQLRRPEWPWPPWGGQGHSGQAIKLKADRNSSSFSALKMGYLVIFGFFFSFSVENRFSSLFYFSFSFQKCHLRWAENVMFATKP